LILSTGK